MSHARSLLGEVYNITLPLRGISPRVVGVVLGGALWTALATVFPEGLMPYPWEVVRLGVGLFQRGVVFENLAATLYATILGFVGAFLLGGSIGVLMGTTGYGRRFFTPHVIAGLSIPAVAWAAVTTISLGLNVGAPIAASVLTVFPYLTINVWKGVEGIDMDKVHMSQSFGVSNRRIIRRLILPSIAPALFSALRFGMAISWKVVTIAEIFAATRGIGYKLIQAYDYYKFADAWAWAFVFFAVILIFEYLLFRPLERKVFEYRPEADLEMIG
jgi:NitT/TauT family transport system permease protein